jgi:hypothetical protein
VFPITPSSSIQAFSTKEVWDMYAKDPHYGTKSYSQFANENDWVMVKGQYVTALSEATAELQKDKDYNEKYLLGEIKKAMELINEGQYEQAHDLLENAYKTF